MEIRKTIRTFITENFLASNNFQNLEDTTSFLENNIVDSTGVLEIIQFIEETYGISIADEELVPENLDSIENLTSFVMRKLGEQNEQSKCAP
jgi:acyl carrier protein